MRGGLRFALSAIALLVTLSASAAELFPIYERYLKAIERGDLDAARSFLSSGKAKSLAGKSKDEALAALDVISPKEKLRAHEEIIDGRDATLIVAADVSGNPSTGRIEFAREMSTWKIVSEMWDISGGPEESEPMSNVRQPENDRQREAIRKLREMGYASPSSEFLVMSAVEGNLEAVKLFIAAGYSPDTMDQGAPAIVRAAMYGHTEVVNYLLEAGANVNATDDVKTTALMRIASKCDATPTVQKLLDAGAKTELQSAGGSTAAQLAEWAGCADNVKAINAKKK